MPAIKSIDLMHRYRTIEEQVTEMLFFASEESSYITCSMLPVGAAASADEASPALSPSHRDSMTQEKCNASG
jgi:hypothetical protein